MRKTYFRVTLGFICYIYFNRLIVFISLDLIYIYYKRNLLSF